MQRLAVDLVEELTSLGHPGDAAHVAAAYLSDADNAVLLFAQSRQWREALRVAHQCVLAPLLSRQCLEARGTRRDWHEASASCRAPQHRCQLLFYAV